MVGRAWESYLERWKRLYGGGVGGAIDAIRGGPGGSPTAAATATAAAAARGAANAAAAPGAAADDRPTTDWDTDPEDEGGEVTEADLSGMPPLPHPGPAEDLTELQKAANDRHLAQWLLNKAVKDQAAAAAAGDVDALTRVNARLTAAQQAYQAAANAFTAEANREETKKKPHQIQKQEKHPNGGTYLVTYDVDAQGNEKWNGQKPQELFPPSAQEGLSLETAQLDLQRARQALAAENDPVKKRQLLAQVETAELALQQARARGPLELKTAQLAYDQAQLAYDQATDPVAKETRLVALEQARTALEVAKQGLARGNVSQIIQPGTGRTITTRDPNTGAISTQPNPAWTPEMEEAQRLELENLRRGQLPQNPLAAYTQEAARLQGEAQKELDRLRDLQRSGAMTAADATTAFQAYMQQRVQPQLAGLRTQAEEAQRVERQQVEERNRQEQIRVDTANRAREQVGYQAGETARSQIMQIAPEIRTPQFLQQYGSMVANMAGRAGAPSAEAANRMPAAPTITADTFNPANFAGAIPDLDTAARQATARALAGISPTAARMANLPQTPLPTGPDLQALLGAVPYQGPLLRPPPGLQPLPDFAAVDIGGGQARSTYPGGGWLDWPIQPPPFGG